jgi:hypothetical protein
MLSFSLKAAVIIGLFAADKQRYDPNAYFDLVSVVGGKTYKLRLTDGALQSSPVWKAKAPNPPVSAAQAIRHATNALNTLIKNVQELKDRNWELGSVDLCSGFGVDRWYWEVRFRPRMEQTKAGTIIAEEFLGIAVLMDGMVLTPSVKPRDK